MSGRILSSMFAACVITLAAGHARAQGDPFGGGSAEPAQEPAPPPPAAPPLPKARKPVGFRGDGGYSLRRVLTLPTNGADVGLAFGRQESLRLAWWGAMRVFYGSTENGLGVWSFRLGPDLDIVFDRVRIDLGLNFFLLGIRRAVREDTVNAWGGALHAGLRVDLLQLESVAIFARADLDYGGTLQTASAYWGPTFGAGVDFDISGSRAGLR